MTPGSCRVVLPGYGQPSVTLKMIWSTQPVALDKTSVTGGRALSPTSEGQVSQCEDSPPSVDLCLEHSCPHIHVQGMLKSHPTDLRPMIQTSSRSRTHLEARAYSEMEKLLLLLPAIPVQGAVTTHSTLPE